MIPSNKICGTCLSQDRRLFKGSVGLKFICPEIKCTKYNMICWECKEYLRKYLRFKKQALRAQNLLLSHTCQNLITTCVSSLTIANVASISITHEIMNESDTYTAQNLVKTLKGKELDIKKEVEWLDEDMTEDQLANAHITSICSNVTSPFEMMVKREELDIKEEVKWADDVVDDMGTKDMMENQLASDMLSVEIENVNSPSENTVKREELYIKEEVKCPDEEFDDETKDMMKNQLAIGSDTHSKYASGAPGLSAKKKLRTGIVTKKCETTYSRLNKAPKTSAERAREFRARKALLKQQSNKQEADAIVVIATGGIRSADPSEDNQGPGYDSEIRTIEKRAKSVESTRRWREKNKNELSKKQAKTVAQRMREYRARKKLAKKIQLTQQSDQDAIVGTSSAQANQRAGISHMNCKCICSRISAELTRGNS